MNSFNDLVSDFKQLDSKFGSIPKWVWNVSLSEVTREEIFEQFKNFKEKDLYAGVMIVLWKVDSYMSEEYFKKYEYALQAAKEIDLHIIIWDENGFPSGYANSELEREHVHLTAKRLDMIEFNLNHNDTLHQQIDLNTFVGAVSMNMHSFERLDISQCVQNGVLTWTSSQDDVKVMIFNCVKANQMNGFYQASSIVDYLDNQAVSKFIEITHQRYYDRFPEYFGNVIKYAFYDEPAFWHVDGGRIWTKAFNRKFIEKYNFNPITLYPAMWYDIGQDTYYARDILFGFRADLYAKEYVGTLAKWCKEHHISLTGHMDQEEIVNPVPISGDLMKVFEHQDVPGVDEIGYYGRGSKAYKLVSSAANNYDKPLVMCEVFGAMGEDMDEAVLMKEAMDEYAKGINFMVPHGTWYCNIPERIIFPPELSYRSKKFASSLRNYNEYVRRCSALLQGGRHVADIAVVYPITDLQSHYYFSDKKAYEGGEIPVYSDYMDIGELLSLSIRKDFTYIHPNVLNEKCSVKNGKLFMNNKTNFEQFSVIIVPCMEVISIKNIEKIKEFYDNGGAIIFSHISPKKVVEQNCDDKVNEIIKQMLSNDNTGKGRAYMMPECSEQSLNKALNHVFNNFDVDITMDNVLENGYFSYIHKVKNNIDIYFFANSSETSICTEILLKGELCPILLDPHTGKEAPANYEHIMHNIQAYTKINISLEPVRSIFVLDQK